ncbi:MAG TPA: DUF4956 domain-containing protein [Bacteroidales bacterium]|nr:DUF4956 domain-containing protein [Bacteroidales bacterium]
MSDKIPSMFEKMFDLSNPYLKEMMIMFVINVIFQYVLIKLVYFRYSKKESFFFAFFMIGLIVYFIGCLLNYIQIRVELAVGLVAIFTILRLRTRSITMKDMAYIFAVIGIAVINALHLVAFPLLGRLIINVIIILAALIMEEFVRRNKCSSYNIIYENIDMLKPEKKMEMLNELSALTGRKIIKVKVEEIDYKKKSAEVVVYWKDTSIE